MIDRQDTKGSRKSSDYVEDGDANIVLFDDEDIRSLLLAERVNSIVRGANLLLFRNP